MSDRVILSEAAKRDLDRLYDFGAQFWTERRIESYLRSLTLACFKLADHPRRGRTRADIGAGLRSFVFREHVIYYHIDSGGVIVIARVMHGRERAPGT